MMAVAFTKDDRLNDGIDFISLPSIDLRKFGGDELRLMAQFSGFFPDANFCNIVFPDVNRSCFNESAGSRKQTYKNRGSSKYSNRALGPSATSVDKNNGRNIGLTNSSGVHCYDDEGRTHSMILDKRIQNAGTGLILGGNVTGRSLASHVARKGSSTSALMWRRQTERKGDRTRDEGRSMKIFGGGEVLLRTESNDWKARKAKAFEMAREGRSSRDVTSVAVEERFASDFATRCPAGEFSGFVTKSLSKNKLKQSIGAFSDPESEEGAAIVNRKRSSFTKVSAEERLVRAKRSRGGLLGTVGSSLFDSREFELDQRSGRSQNHTGGGDMVERLARMKGDWSSRARTRKVVHASGFPLGWTVRVGLRFKDGRTLFEYRDWRSPDGTLCSSFKDASAFLLSSLGRHSTAGIMVLLKPGRGNIRGKEISAMKDESTSEVVRGGSENLAGVGSLAAVIDPRKCYPVQLSDTLDKTRVGGHVHRGFCSKQVSRAHLDEFVGRCSTLEQFQI